MTLKKTTMKKTKILSTTLLMCAAVFIQTAQASETQQDAKPIAPYGDNPNLLHVFAYKTQQGVINTAEKVGAVAEKGIAKIKPGVDRAWGNTKSTAATTIEKVDQTATQAAQQTGQKIQQTKDVWRGNPQQVPIEQQPLSQSSTTTQSVTPQPSSTGGTTSYAVDDL
ncbi:hypothetical protein Asch01_02387 [Acinetobacter schindleri]|uniref:hypothetical protein n=1 Tax=Acinetobacter schindleri TaxID=108981 RepID=UPI0030B75CBC